MFGFFKPAPPQDDLPFSVDARSINIIVGLIALLLPFALLLSAWRTNSPFMYSISHFYYTRIGGDILVGALSVIGIALLFFYRYRGDKVQDHPAHSWWNARWANLAGLCALGVAFFPTGDWGYQYPVLSEASDLVSRFFLTGTQASGSIYDLATKVEGAVTHDFWLSFGEWRHVSDVPWLIYNAHYISAAGMFAILGYFSLFVFTLPQNVMATKGRAAGGAPTEVKWWRNLIYRLAGVVIFAAIAGLAIKMGVHSFWYKGDAAAQKAFLECWNGWHLTFYLESLALMAFGVSWMVKGRFIGALNDAPG